MAGKEENKESFLQWFDRAAENEINKKLQQINATDNVVELNTSSSSPLRSSPTAKGTFHPHVVASSTSGLDISNRLRSEADTELAEAAEKMAKAQAMCAFAGAVQAAEQAAAAAPPEFAEEAAAAGARGYQAELTGVVKEIFPGVRPVEVIGYVGITRPKIIRRS